jgi:glycine dehydrogenase subunit 1
MAIRVNKKSKDRRVLMVGPFAPWVMDTVKSITSQQNIRIDLVEHLNFQKDPAHAAVDYAALVIAQPNFLGQIVEVDALTDWAHEHGQVVIAYVNPMAMSLLKPPGEWGKTGADIACGEGQPLGIPLSFGGPYFGFLCCKLQDARQMPGRIVGKTKDADGHVAFCLTLQAREQHIRRAKATSNICTNQGLMVTAATIYMTLMGARGLYQVAAECHSNAQSLAHKLCEIPGISLAIPGPFYCEFPIHLPVNVDVFLKQMEEVHHVQAGLALKSYRDDMKNVMLVTTTEIHDHADHEFYIRAFQTVLSQLTGKGA